MYETDTLLGTAAPDIPDDQREFLALIHKYGDQHRLWSLKGHVNLSIFLGLAFYRGFQNLTVSRSSNFVQEIPTRKSAQFLNVNLILGGIRAIISMLAAVRPWPVVLPEDDTPEAYVRASITQKVIVAYHERLRLRRLWQDLLEWLVPCGDAFVKLRWNSMEGPATVGLRIRPNGSLEARRFRAGEPEAVLCSPIELSFPYGATRVGEQNRCPYWVQTFLMSKIGALRQFGERARGIKGKAPFPTFGPESWESRILNLSAGLAAKSSGSPTGGTSAAWAEEDYLLGRELHILSENPDQPGRHGVEAHGVLLDYGPCHFDELTQFSFIRMPGQMWNLGACENAIHPQRAFNRFWNQRIEWRELVLNGRVLSEKGSSFKRAQHTNLPFEVWEYVSNVTGSKPEWMQVAQWGADAYRDLELMKGDLADVLGVHPVTLGQVPPNLRAGNMLQMAQEADQKFHSPTLASIKDSWEDLYTRLAVMLRRHVLEIRQVQVGSGEEWVAFSGSMIPERPRIQVQLIPESTTAKAIIQAHVLDLVQYKGLDLEKPEDKAIVIRALEIPSSEFALQTVTADVELQQREIVKMVGDPVRGREGVEVPVDQIHDHPIHMKVIDLLVKSPSWDRYDEPTQGRILRHRAAHAAAQAEATQAYAEVAAPLIERINAAENGGARRGSPNRSALPQGAGTGGIPPS